MPVGREPTGVTQMRPIKIIAGAILTTIAAAFSGAVHADTQKLTVGVEELDYFPNYAVRDGRYTGAARDILDAFAADSGFELVYQPLPIKRLYADLFNGSVDLKFPDNPDWNGDGKKGYVVVYSQPVLPFTDGVMVLPARVGKGMETFKTLGTVIGFTPFAWLDVLAQGKIKLTETPQMGPLLRQALTGRVDGAYVNVAVAKYLMRTMLDQPSGLVFDPSLPHSQSSYRLSTIRHGVVVDKLNAWLAAHTNQVAEIKARYGLDE